MNLDSLLISRDASLLGVLRPALEKISVDVQVSTDSRTGNDLLAKEKFDAVIIDCDDLENGFSLLKNLRQARTSFCKSRLLRCKRRGVLTRPSISWFGNGDVISAIPSICPCASAFQTIRK